MTTTVVEYRNSGSKLQRYDIIVRAGLISPYFVELASPRPLSPKEIAHLHSASRNGVSVEQWRAFTEKICVRR